MVYVYVRDQKMKRDKARRALPIATVSGDSPEKALINALQFMDPFQRL